ncbi:MAG: hypothetical protein R3D46_15805 [Defluviimonas denitrificans]
MFGTDPILLLTACAITLFAGTVKGAVGFAMPMIMISGLASILPADQALAALIVPTLVTNLAQSFRQGGGSSGPRSRNTGGFWCRFASSS